ncbi:hypothetical protein HN011_007606 [Eciton burchellii]|nr:hypothetical protein HN011_007606 [Eciton burchellii]
MVAEPLRSLNAIMAEIFKSGVIGPAELCQKISNSLHQNALERRWQISIHQCESIADVIKTRLDISVDFIIFAFDSRTVHTLSEVEVNITLIDEHYIISGAACLVNCNGISNVTELIHKSKKFCHKYNIRFLSANVFDIQACVQLGSRILNITEGLLGLNSGIPIIQTSAQHN